MTCMNPTHSKFPIGSLVLVKRRDNLGHEFEAKVKRHCLDTDGSAYFTVVDQDDDAYDVVQIELTMLN